MDFDHHRATGEGQVAGEFGLSAFQSGPDHSGKLLECFVVSAGLVQRNGPVSAVCQFRTQPLDGNQQITVTLGAGSPVRIGNLDRPLRCDDPAGPQDLGPGSPGDGGLPELSTTGLGQEEQFVGGWWRSGQPILDQLPGQSGLLVVEFDPQAFGEQSVVVFESGRDEEFAGAVQVVLLAGDLGLESGACLPEFLAEATGRHSLERLTGGDQVRGAIGCSRRHHADAVEVCQGESPAGGGQQQLAASGIQGAGVFESFLQGCESIDALLQHQQGLAPSISIQRREVCQPGEVSAVGQRDQRRLHPHPQSFGVPGV